MVKTISKVIPLLFLSLAAVSGVYAQTPPQPNQQQSHKITSPPAPTEPVLFSPESGQYRATMGTISSDIDGFMDVGGFKDTSFTSSLFYMGFDPQGVTVGMGIKITPMVYAGIAYGGSLIQDLLNRATNQSTSDLKLSLNNDVPGVYTATGERPAEALSRNEFNVFLGIWRVGLCVGFSQILSALQPKTGEMS
ncbi:MAG: hypothetical protein LBD08_04920, partial [Treponema sp.]|nr:hypothetical protein [Treponema sp.]